MNQILKEIVRYMNSSLYKQHTVLLMNRQEFREALPKFVHYIGALFITAGLLIGTIF